MNMIERIKIFLALFENFFIECKVVLDDTNKKNSFSIQFDFDKEKNNYYSTIDYGNSYGMNSDKIKIKKIKTKKPFILEVDCFVYDKNVNVSSKNNLFYSEDYRFIEK